MSRPVDYVICAAGKGERFKVSGFDLPKPLIRLNEITLLERSLTSLDFYKGDRLILITQKEDKIKSKLERKIADTYPQVEIVWLEITEITSGQLETFYLAKNYLRKKDASVVIFNCDTYFRSRELNALMSDETIEGIIPCAKAQGNAWSFCKVNSKNEVLAVKEKVRISPWATVGFYFFRDANKLLYMSKEYLKNNENETYVAPLYQEYIQKKFKVKICQSEIFLPMGTFEQLQSFWKTSRKEVISQNTKRVLVIDLDDTITINDSSNDYKTKKPNKDIVKMLQKYHAEGFEIVIYTARNMKTQRNDEGKVVANIGAVTIEWLKKHKVPYNSIRFGKPYAECGFYVDDRAIRPSEFLGLPYEKILKLLEKE